MPQGRTAVCGREAGPDKDTDSCGFFRGNVCVFQKKERRCRRMKMLFLNVSPRRDGGVARMLEAMADEARARGAEVVCERVSSLSVRACTGCMVCRGEGRCVLPPDDAQRVLELLRWCDVLVVGTPCYWGNMPGTLKVLFDRMVYGMMGESRRGMPRPLLKGRRAWLVGSVLRSSNCSMMARIVPEGGLRCRSMQGAGVLYSGISCTPTTMTRSTPCTPTS